MGLINCKRSTNTVNRRCSKFRKYLLLYLLSFVETPRKFIIAELSIRKLGSSSVLIILLLLLIFQEKYSSCTRSTQTYVFYILVLVNAFVDACCGSLQSMNETE